MRTKYNADQKSSPTPSQESLVSHHSTSFDEAIAAAAEKTGGPFMPKAFCTYSGHTSDLLDVSWSKNYFILSSSMDKTVRLWHISRRECLCCFQHIDFVTAIAFHPRDDRYFLSGSLDGKLRLWNIPDKKVCVFSHWKYFENLLFLKMILGGFVERSGRTNKINNSSKLLPKRQIRCCWFLRRSLFIL